MSLQQHSGRKKQPIRASLRSNSRTSVIGSQNSKPVKTFASNANPDAKLSLSKTDRTPTMPEKIDMINRWFASCAKGKNYKQVDFSIDRIAELMVQKQLSSDIDTGIKMVLKSLNIREQDKDEVTINYALFQRIFIRCVFKESLVEVLHEIEEGVYRAKKKDPQQAYSRSPTLRSPNLRSPMGKR